MLVSINKDFIKLTDKNDYSIKLNRLSKGNDGIHYKYMRGNKFYNIMKEAELKKDVKISQINAIYNSLNISGFNRSFDYTKDIMECY